MNSKSEISNLRFQISHLRLSAFIRSFIIFARDIKISHTIFAMPWAILSAVIFNAIIIPLLIPIALKGVTYRPVGADALLRRNLLIWGLGGVIVPFIGIKLIDMFLVTLHLVSS